MVYELKPCNVLFWRDSELDPWITKVSELPPSLESPYPPFLLTGWLMGILRSIIYFFMNAVILRRL